MEGYQSFGGIKRTLSRRAWWLADWQALPPAGWCVSCGAEVYRPGRELCVRCREHSRYFTKR